ncbi:hypothetical protein DENSPDRAFT_842574 [Dentipellis sp. KUC8613]|nr:hypothetical protein DENSPDRAFT_842574 [Dentipellis sp. KUC8613]
MSCDSTRLLFSAASEDLVSVTVAFDFDSGGLVAFGDVRLLTMPGRPGGAPERFASRAFAFTTGEGGVNLITGNEVVVEGMIASGVLPATGGIYWKNAERTTYLYVTLCEQAHCVAKRIDYNTLWRQKRLGGIKTEATILVCDTPWRHFAGIQGSEANPTQWRVLWWLQVQGQGQW